MARPQVWAVIGVGIALVAVTSYYFRNQIDYVTSVIGNEIEDFSSDAPKITTINGDGVACNNGTPASPEGLAGDRDLNTYALARMIESETGVLKQYSAKLGVAYAATNYAQRLGKSISAILLRASNVGNGYFGTQEHGRYASTSKDPSDLSLAIAGAAIARLQPDPTGGADQWDSPWSYATPGRAAEVAAARIAAGKVKVVLDDVPERKLRFWRYE